MEAPKHKRKRITVKVPTLNNGTNTPVLTAGVSQKLAEGEAALYKQAENPLGDPNKFDPA